MAHKKNNTNLTELLLQCMTQPDPMLSMLEWLCTRLMETEVDQQLGAEKSQRSDGRSGYRSGYRPSRLDTCLLYTSDAAVWTHVWGRCTSWFLRYGRAVISRSLSQSASAVKQRSFRSFRSPFCEHPLTQSFVILTKYVVM